MAIISFAAWLWPPPPPEAEPHTRDHPGITQKSLYIPSAKFSFKTLRGFLTEAERLWQAACSIHSAAAAGKAHGVTTSHLKPALILFRVELSSRSGDRQTAAAACARACVIVHV